MSDYYIISENEVFQLSQPLTAPLAGMNTADSSHICPSVSRLTAMCLVTIGHHGS